MTWMLVDNLWGNAFPFGTVPATTAVLGSKLQCAREPELLYPGSMNPNGSFTVHDNLPVTPGFETRDILPSSHAEPGQGEHPSPRFVESSASKQRSDQSLFTTVPNVDNGAKPDGRRRHSSPTEFQPSPKRRQSCNGKDEEIKRAEEYDELPLEAKEDAVESKEEDVSPPKDLHATKAAHSIVERRYRENLNSKITQLQLALSLARYPVTEPKGHSVDKKSADPPDKLRKAEVLVEAIQYVQRAEREKMVQADETAFLRLRVTAFEKLITRDHYLMQRS
jgi:Helix-loop-helix DNA-binding domain